MRRHIRIERDPDEVWAVVGDPARLGEWFPVVAVEVAGDKRWITLASGLRFEEDIVTLDDDLHRFQYRIVGNPLVHSHLGTVDVLGDGGASIVVYSTDAEPDVFALIIGGAAGAGLIKLREMLEGDVH